MFDKPYIERLKLWRDFRNNLETSDQPLDECLEFWNKAPISSIATDPYDSDLWPDPWEMILNNTYCEFTKILAIYYTLQLSERFLQSQFEIHITLDREESKLRYLLFVDNQAIGYYYDKCINITELPVLQSEMHYKSLPTY